MKTRIPALTVEAASSEAKTLLEGVNKKLGFLPNLVKVMGHSPATLKGYLQLGELTSSGNFKNKFREQLALAIAQENECNYCLSAHTAIGKMQGLDASRIQENRLGRDEDQKTQAALQFAKEITKTRGRVSENSIQAFRSAGHNDEDALEIVLNVVHNTLTNYVNHLANTEIDFPLVEAKDLYTTT